MASESLCLDREDMRKFGMRIGLGIRYQSQSNEMNAQLVTMNQSPQLSDTSNAFARWTNEALVFWGGPLVDRIETWDPKDGDARIHK